MKNATLILVIASALGSVNLAHAEGPAPATLPRLKDVR